MVTFEPSMWGIYILIFRPLALLVWVENKLTDKHTWDAKHSLTDPNIQNF